MVSVLIELVFSFNDFGDVCVLSFDLFILYRIFSFVCCFILVFFFDCSFKFFEFFKVCLVKIICYVDYGILYRIIKSVESVFVDYNFSVNNGCF